MTVWVDAWQMQCCGDNFSVGSRVSWTLADAVLTSVRSADGWTLDRDDLHFSGYLVDVTA